MSSARSPLVRFWLQALWLVVPFVALSALTVLAWRADERTRRERAVARAVAAARIMLDQREGHLNYWSEFPATETILLPPVPVGEDSGSQPARERYEAGDYEGVLGGSDSARSDAGLRLRALAALQLLRKETQPARLTELAGIIAANPDFTTPPLMEEAARRFEELKLGCPGIFHLWSDHWARLQSEAELATIVRARKLTGPAVWVPLGTQLYLVEIDSLTGLWRAHSEAELANMDRIFIPQVLPDGYAIRLECAGRVIGELGEGSVVETVPRGAWVARILLADENALLAGDAKSRRMLVGVLAAAALAAAFGLWQAGRGYMRAVELADRQSGFMAAVSHEMRTPLAAMRLLAENLESGVAERAGESAGHLRLLRGECARLSTLVENVLAFSGKSRVAAFEALSPSDLLDDLSAMLVPVAERLGVRLETSADALPTAPMGDAAALRRLILNLLDNALKHTPPGGSVVCRIEPEAPAHWRIEVADTGPGVPVAERDRVFEPFYRIGSELRRTTPGVGLGLALVRLTAIAHGGRAGVSDSPGGGALFTVTLPLQPPAPRR